MNCWPSGKYVNLLYMYSILGRGYFCFNYCLNSAWHGGGQFVALLRWYGSPGFFDSGLQLIFIFLVSCFSFSSWQYPINALCGSDLVSLLASQSLQLVCPLTNFWCFWQCGQVPNPAGKENQHLLKAGQQREAWSAPKCLGKRVQWRWFSKNTMDQHQQMTLHPKSSQTVET